jgi:hypothetical protein
MAFLTPHHHVRAMVPDRFCLDTAGPAENANLNPAWINAQLAPINDRHR